MDAAKKIKVLKIVPSKKLGQNFLNNQHWAKKIVNNLTIKENTNIIEVGPGLGAISDVIIKNMLLFVPHSKLVLIEKDAKLYDYLKTRYQKQPWISLYNEDILKFNFHILADKSKYQAIGNLPYIIATKILKLFFWHRQYFSVFYFAFPEGIANKILVAEGQKSYFLTIITHLFSQVQKVMVLEPECFIPKPKIKSVLIRFIPKDKLITDKPELFIVFLSNCFRYKRKTLINNLKSNYKNLSEVKITQFLQDHNLPLLVRAENLNLTLFHKLFEQLDTCFL